MRQSASRIFRSAFAALLGLSALGAAAPAAAALTVEPLTWNIVGLDSNTPATGPEFFPVGARVCSNVATTNVTVNYVWDSANAFVNLRPGSLSSIVFPAIPAGGCVDAYFEVAVTKNPAAFETTRRYRITATDSTGTASTPAGRELYVERLVSQARNAITNVSFGPVGGPLTSVPAGGSMNLAVGSTYDIRLEGGTATGGYEQFAAFINFSNAIFRITSVQTTLSVTAPPRVVSPNNRLYQDACLWENDPNSPNYRACLSTGKAGGSTVVTTYSILIVGGGGTSQTLNTLLYDFSGSSFHYNADYGVGARVANIIDPATAGIAKAFVPSTTNVGGVAKLNITLTNPNAGALSGYAFTDVLPANLTIASPTGLTVTGCGTPTFSPAIAAGGNTIGFSNGTVAANSSCVISVNVTPSATGSLVNTTQPLFIGPMNTGKTATATLTVDNSPPPPPPLCGVQIATWNFLTGSSATNPAPTTGTGSANAGAGLTPSIQTDNVAGASGSWASDNIVTGPLNTANNEYFEFVLNTSGFSSVDMSFQGKRTAQGPTVAQVFSGLTGSTAGPSFTLTTAFQAFGPVTINSGLNPSGNTLFRIYLSSASQNNNGHFGFLDGVTFTGCVTPQQPTVGKAFSPTTIGVGGTSTLTLTLTNPNSAALSSAAISDALPAGMQVAATPAAANTCGGTWNPLAGQTSLTLTGGTIPANGSCTVSVNVTATTPGPKLNTTGSISTAQTGTNVGATGSASATLTALAPPVIDKTFSPSPILANGVSTLTFVIVNPNPDTAISQVAFSDTLPTSPGQMRVAATPNASTTGCGTPVFAPAANATSLTFTGGSIAAGGTCTVRVNVTAPANGSYNNTSGVVSHVVAGSTFNGNTTSDTLVVNAPSPSVSLLKQVAAAPAGPWLSSLAVAPGGNVFYRVLVENTGDVLLDPATISDAMFPGLAGTCGFPRAIPVADAFDDDHLVTCNFGPVTAQPGLNVNTAQANATGAGTPVSDSDSANYATTALSLSKSANPTTYTAAGDTINYSFLVTNTGFAALQGPVTVNDPLVTVTCPAVATAGDLDNFLDPGESLTCTATYTITGSDVTAGSVTNTATATVAGVTSPPSSTTVTTPQSADLSVAKVLATAGPYAPGASVSFTITVSNAGPNAASNVSLSDTDTNLTVTNVTSGTMTCTGGAFPCTLASLANGASATVTVTATVDAVGAFSNSATVTSATPDPVPGNNTGTDGGTATSADLAVSKVLTTAGPYTAGSAVSFTVTVTNNGPSPATNVTVTDVDTNLTVTSVTSGTMTCAGSAFPCTQASLASGASATITVNATVDANGAFSNSATATSDTPDPVPGNNTGTDGNGATSADLAVTKVLSTAGPHAPGSSVSFLITVTNTGPDTASNLSLTDTDTNLTVTNVTSGTMTCTGGAFPCTLASLANGASATVTVTATVDAVGAFSNSATVTSATPDPVPGNNTGTDGGTATSADLSITKTVDNATPTVGTNVTFTLTVSNAGPSAATAVSVNDLLPAGYTFVSSTPSQGSYVAGTGVWTVGNLANGASATLAITATVNASGPYANTATVTSSTNDPDPTDNSDTETPVPGGSADLSITKTVDNATPTVGTNVTFTLTVSNAGPSAATAVSVNDLLPAGYTFVSSTPSQGSYVAGTGVWTVGNLANGASATLAITATVNASGPYANTAAVTSSTNDPDPTDNSDTETPVPGASADLSIVKTASTPSPTVGGPMAFTLTLANAGPSGAASVVVNDLLPAGYTFVSAVPSQGTYNAGTGTWTVGNVASGAGATLTINVTVNASGPYANTASVTSSTPDPDPSDNSDTETPIPVEGGPGQADLSVLKTNNNATPTVGTNLTFTVAVTNSGPDTAVAATLQDLLPAGYTFVSATPSRGSYAAGTGVWTIGDMTNGSSATLTIVATVNASGPYANTATVTSSTPDPDPADNSSTSTPTPQAAVLMADLAVVKTGPAQIERGQQVTFSIQVRNLGPDTAVNTRLIDPTPPGLVFVSTAGACTGPFPCTLGDLANGAVRNLTATYLVPADYSGPNMIVNTVTAQSDSQDPTPGDTSSSSSVLVPAGVPNLAVPRVVPVDARWALILLAAMMAMLAGLRLGRR